ncbi:hypothetical protein HNR62_002986 [Oceanisphaera litoralis]|uniref:DUF2066 domain-containing protein n=1 Tax=Oceanisphaera litoralis TaxID=225144 RepID=UPI00195B5CD7|nr:DUF2066 domain-containing protein [Oceanisphaera litoralis]MBM7457084.1 hypothetical protein [Oceanisphaera litoralis]
MLKNLLLTTLLLCSAAVSARSVFEVNLDPAPYDRSEARAQAVELVLNRLTGGRANGSWVLDEARGEVSRYLQSEPPGPGYNAVFNEAELLALLESAELPFSLASRPALLVWLSQEGRSRNEANRVWRRASSAYQIPLLWPLWDLEEHMTLSTRELFDAKPLREASRRYGADYWLVVEQKTEQQNAAGGRWQLFGTGQEQPLLQGKLAQGKLASGADAVTELMARLNRYWVEQNGHRRAPKPANPAPEQPLLAKVDAGGELTIVVSGLRRFADTVLLERKLRQLDGVDAVHVIDSAGYQGRYRLSVPGSRAAVLQALTTMTGLVVTGEREFSWSGAKRD